MSGLLKAFGLDKVAKLGQIIKDHGGLKASLYHLYRTDDLKVGRLYKRDTFDELSDIIGWNYGG